MEALVDCDMEVRYWHYPTEMITFLPENNEETSTIQIFTDRSKSEQGVGAGIAIFRSGKHTKSLKYGLNKRCTNNQAEQLALVRALDYTENLQTEDKMATTHTDICVYVYIYIYIQGVPRVKVTTSGECSLC